MEHHRSYSYEAIPVEFHLGMTSVVEEPYTTDSMSELECFMAFLRRKGNTFYLVHNVRKGDRIKQLHLAKLGERLASRTTWYGKSPVRIRS